MSREFTLPDLGEGVKEGQVLRLLVAEGERVDEDQMLMEVETDKAAVEIPSPYSGVIARWHVAEKQVVNVGEVMVTFDDVAAAPERAHRSAKAGAAMRVAAASEAAPGATVATAAPPTPPTSGRKPASPAVRKLARQLGVNLDQVAGTGPGGRVLRADVEQAGAGTATTAAAPSTPTATPPVHAAPPSPAAAAPAPSPGPGPAPGTLPPGADDRDEIGPVRRVAITPTRKAITTVMSHSMATIPHVTDCDDADVTDLERMRRGYNESVAPEERVGLLAFVMRAVARALQMHPVLNASLDESRGEIVYKRYFNVALGVQTERGLVAPVLHDVDGMTVPRINAELTRVIAKAHGGTFSLEETRGATYTISNAGALGGSRYSTPIITPPQVAVLAIGRSRRQPWLVNDRIEPRLIMPLSHSMDHRIIDGALEIAFMKQLIGDLENPARLMM